MGHLGGGDRGRVGFVNLNTWTLAWFHSRPSECVISLFTRKRGIGQCQQIWTTSMITHCQNHPLEYMLKRAFQSPFYFFPPLTFTPLSQVSLNHTHKCTQKHALEFTYLLSVTQNVICNHQEHPSSFHPRGPVGCGRFWQHIPWFVWFCQNHPYWGWE